MTEQAARGRRLVMGALAAMVVVSLISTTLSAVLSGGEGLAQDLIRTALTVALCYAVYQGRAWARWLTVALLGLGGLVSLGAGLVMLLVVPLGGAALLLLGVVYIACVVVLAAAPSARAFFAEARAVARPA